MIKNESEEVDSKNNRSCNTFFFIFITSIRYALKNVTKLKGKLKKLKIINDVMFFVMVSELECNHNKETCRLHSEGGRK